MHRVGSDQVHESGEASLEKQTEQCSKDEWKLIRPKGGNGELPRKIKPRGKALG